MSNQLKQRRKELNLTQEMVAGAVGTTKATIMKLEKGQMQLTESWMKRLATPLQCKPSDLIAEHWPTDVPLIGLVTSKEGLALYRPLPATNLREAGNYWEGLEVVERPPEGGYRQVVAMRVQGDEFEPFLSAGSLIYAADPIEKDFKKYLNQMVICRLNSGATVIKKLRAASNYGAFTLEGINSELMQNVEINWCAKIIFFKPA